LWTPPLCTHCDRGDERCSTNTHKVCKGCLTSSPCLPHSVHPSCNSHTWFLFGLSYTGLPTESGITYFEENAWRSQSHTVHTLTCRNDWTLLAGGSHELQSPHPGAGQSEECTINSHQCPLLRLYGV
jgi:hypothetical protein